MKLNIIFLTHKTTNHCPHFLAVLEQKEIIIGTILLCRLHQKILLYFLVVLNCQGCYTTKGDIKADNFGRHLLIFPGAKLLNDHHLAVLEPKRDHQWTFLLCGFLLVFLSSKAIAIKNKLLLLCT